MSVKGLETVESEAQFVETTLHRLTKLDFLYFWNSYKAAKIDFQDKSTGVKKGEKHYRLVKMDNVEEGYRHAAIVISDLGPEYRVLPEAVQEYLVQDEKPDVTIEDPVEATSITNHDFTFTRTVYLYTDVLRVPKEEVIKYFQDNNMRLVIRDDDYRRRVMRTQEVDFFVCHDSADKEAFVKPLAEALRNVGINVWYDEFSIRWGDSIIDKIEDGLKKCKFGIVVISKNFIKNSRWPHTEFKSLRVREHVIGKNLIRAIWLEVSREEVAQYSLDLADRKALLATEGIPKIVDECIFVLKPPFRAEETSQS